MDTIAGGVVALNAFRGLVFGVSLDANSTPFRAGLFGLGDRFCKARLGDSITGERRCSGAMFAAA